MKILIDTNVVRSQGFFFASARFQVIKTMQSPLAIRVLIPEIVKDESIQLYRNDYYLKLKRVTDSLSSLSVASHEKYTIDPIPNQPEIAEELYRQRFNDNQFDIRLEILDYPGVTHKEIAAAAISRHRPFDSKGSGYRDYLVWSTLLEHLATDPIDSPLHFITEDHDFANPEQDSAHPTLHADLINSLVRKGLAAESIVLHQSLRSFVANELSQYQAKNTDAARALESDEFPDEFYFEELAAAHDSWWREHVREVAPERFGLPPEVTFVQAVLDAYISQFSNITAYNLSEHVVFIESDVKVPLQLLIEIESGSGLARQMPYDLAATNESTVEGVVSLEVTLRIQMVVESQPFYSLKKADFEFLDSGDTYVVGGDW